MWASSMIEPLVASTRVRSAYASSEHLKWLEAQAIHIIREVASQCSRPALLFSAGKDSVVLFHLARKAFCLGTRALALPFPLVHIDTGHNFPEVISFRDEIVKQTSAPIVIGQVDDSIARGSVVLANPLASRNEAQAVTLLETIESWGFDALLGGARRDEEKSRAKERVFSIRDRFGQWNPKKQRPELWNLYNGKIAKGEHLRVFPLSNWTELDIWEYIQRERLALPTIYFAHLRAVVPERDLLVPVTTLTPATSPEMIEMRMVRFRTVGDMSCTCPVTSDASTVEEIIDETRAALFSERGATRRDDKTSEASMERRKREGYF
jgi:sulfate adenylyltransferase subunit 2